MKRLHGKVAVVTGASKGIGAGIAQAMGGAGASVVVNYATDHAGARQTVAAIEACGGRASAVQADVSVAADAERLFAEAQELFGPLDILVNNAGVFSFAPLERITDEQLQRMLGINLLGTIITCRSALAHFNAAGGSIVNIGSMATVRYAAGRIGYAASKAGVTAVTGVLAVELAPRRIRVNQINPGAVETEGAHGAGAMTDEARAAYTARTLLGRIGTPKDIASVALFLASDEACWLTGEIIGVSGGLR